MEKLTFYPFKICDEWTNVTDRVDFQVLLLIFISVRTIRAFIELFPLSSDIESITFVLL